MNGLKEALEYAVELKKPEIVNVGGEDYSDKRLYRICHNPKAGKIGMTTLTSLVEYLKAGIDDMDGRMIVHVVSPTRVLLCSPLDLDREREYMVEVNAQVPEFRYGSYGFKVSAPPTPGPTLAKQMRTLSERYGVRWEFCSKQQTGKRIIEILRDGL